MRRAATWISLTLTSLVLAALPALATEGEEADAAADYFGAGQWDGMILAGIVGIVVGAIIVSAVAGGAAERHEQQPGQH